MSRMAEHPADRGRGGARSTRRARGLATTAHEPGKPRRQGQLLGPSYLVSELLMQSIAALSASAGVAVSDLGIEYFARRR